MTAIELRIQGQVVTIDGAGQDRRRLEDLAALLNTRLGAFPPDVDMRERLALTALSLLDETQARAAALVRARAEIERLTDMMVEARLAASPARVDEERGRVDALRVANGA